MNHFENEQNSLETINIELKSKRVLKFQFKQYVWYSLNLRCVQIKYCFILQKFK